MQISHVLPYSQVYDCVIQSVSTFKCLSCWKVGILSIIHGIAFIILFIMPYRESLANKDLLVPLVSVGLLDPWDPLDWLDLMVSLVVR